MHQVSSIYLIILVHCLFLCYSRCRTRCLFDMKLGYYSAKNYLTSDDVFIRENFVNFYYFYRDNSDTYRNKTNHVFYLYNNEFFMNVKNATVNSIKIWKLKNINIDSRGCLIFTDGRYRHHSSNEEFLYIQGFYKRVIVNYHHDTYKFGHFLDDHLTLYLVFNSKVRSSEMFVGQCKNNEPYHPELYKSVGLNPDNMICIRRRHIIHSSTAYYISNNYVSEHFADLMKTLRSSFEEHFSLGSVIPRRYIFVNRPKGFQRCFNNAEEITNFLTDNFNHIPWEFYLNISGPLKESINETVLLWRESKMVIQAVGTSTTNCVFMDRNSSMLVLTTPLEGKRIVHHFWDFCHLYASQVWTYYVSCENLVHYGKGDYNLSTKILYHPIKCLLYALENDRWPADTTLSSYPEIYTT